MRRLVAAGAALLLCLGIATQVNAAEPFVHNGRVIISSQGDVTIPAGEHADVVVVVQGSATVLGEVNTLVVVDGAAALEGARLETVVAVSSSVEVATGTVITGELQRFDSTVHQSGDVEIRGGITDMSGWLIQAGAVLAPAQFLLWIGFGVSTIVAALFLAAIAAGQVRQAERMIARDPLMTGLVGFVGVIAIPVTAVLLLVTIVGAPLGLGVLLAVLPLLAYAGYLVAAIWVGEVMLRRLAPGADRERPYLAAVIGVIVLGAIGLVPILGLVASVASLLGFGAILRLGFQAMRGTPQPTRGQSQPIPTMTAA